MAITIEVIHTTIGTAGSTQNVTVSGFGTPLGALVFVSAETADGPASPSADMILCMGATDFTRRWCCAQITEHASDPSQCVNFSSQTKFIAVPLGTGLSIDMEATVSAITDGIQLNWGATPGTAYRMMIVLFNGPDFSCEVGVQVTDATVVDSARTITFLDMEEEPEGIIIGGTLTGQFAGSFAVDATLSMGFGRGVAAPIQQGCQGYNDDDGRTAKGRHGQHTRDNRIAVFPSYASTTELLSLELTGTSVNGTPRGQFELTKRVTGATVSYGWFAWSSNGTNAVHVTVPVLDTNTSGVKSYTAPGFRPQFAMLLPGNLPSVNVGNIGNNAAGIGVSAWGADELAGHYSGHSSEADPALAGSYFESVVMNQRGHGGGNVYRATTPAFTATGFDFTMATTSAVDKAVPILCIEEDTVAGIDLTPGPATATAAAPSLLLNLTLLPDAAAATVSAPAVLLALTLFPDPSVATAAAPAPVLEMTYSQAAAVAAAAAPAVLLAPTLHPDPSVATAAAPAVLLALTLHPDAGVVAAQAPAVAINFGIVLLPAPSVATAVAPALLLNLRLHPDASVVSVEARANPRLNMAYAQDAAVVAAQAPAVALNFGIVLLPGPSILTATAPAVLLALTLHPDAGVASAVAPALLLALTLHPDAGVVAAQAPAVAINFGIVLQPDPAIASAAAPAVLLAQTLFPGPSIASAVAPAPVLEMAYSQDAATVNAAAPAVALSFGIVLQPGPSIASAAAPAVLLAQTLFPGPSIAAAVVPAPVLEMRYIQDAAVVAVQAAAPQLEMRLAQDVARLVASAPVVTLGGDTVLLPGPAVLTAAAPVPSLLGLGIRIQAGPAVASAVAKSPLLDLPWLEVVEFDLMICRMLEPDLLITREHSPELLITRVLEESLER